MPIPPTFPLFFCNKILTTIVYSSHLSCFDALAQTIINLWPLKTKKVSDGGVSPQELKKKCNFQTQFQQFGVYFFCQHFTENPLFISNKVLAIITSIPLTFSDLIPLPELITFAN